MASTNVSKVLLLSYGTISRKHIIALRHLWPNISIAVCHSLSALKTTPQDIISFHNIDNAISWKPDFAIICSPSTLHITQAICLASCNIPTLIEKPLSPHRVTHNTRMKLLELSSNVPIRIAYLLRQDEGIAYIKDYLSNVLRQPYLEADFYCGSWLPDWRPNLNYEDSVSARRCLGGGALSELSHEIDLANFFFGTPVALFSYHTTSPLLHTDVEDSSVIVATCNSCNPLTFRLNFCTSPARRVITMRSREFELNYDLICSKLVINSLSSPPVNRYFYNDSSALFYSQLQSFVYAMHGHDTNLCTVSEAFDTLDFILECKSHNSFGLFDD